MARDGLTFDDLLGFARRVGVEVVAAPSSHRGNKGRMGTVVGVTLHHTGTPNSARPAEDYPDYQVVKEGRAGLVNSLSAYGVGRHKAIYVFSEFLSWHAGTWSYAGITDGNGHFLGIEAAGIGDWTPFQVDVYPRLVASILLGIGEGLDMMPRHMDGAMPRGRKTDAANLPVTFRALVAHYLAHPEQIPVTYTAPVAEEEDDDMASIVRNADTGEMVVAAPGFWQPIPGPGYIDLYFAAGLVKSRDTKFQANTAQFEHLRAVCLAMEGNDEAVLAELRKLSVDEAQRAAAVSG